MPTTVPVLVDFWCIGPRTDDEAWAAICMANGRDSSLAEFTVAGGSLGEQFNAAMKWQRRGKDDKISCEVLTSPSL